MAVRRDILDMDFLLPESVFIFIQVFYRIGQVKFLMDGVIIMRSGILEIRLYQTEIVIGFHAAWIPALLRSLLNLGMF